MKRARPRTLFWELSLPLILMLVMASVLVGAYGFIKVTQFHRRQTLEELRAVMPLAVAQLKPAVASGEVSAERAVVETIAAQSGSRVTLITPEGLVTADSAHDPGEMDNHRFRPEIDAALRQGTGSAVRFSDTLGHDMMYFAAVVTHDGTPVVVARLAKAVAAVDRELTDLLRGIAGVGLVVVVLMLSFIYVRCRRFSRAVQTLAAGTQRLAARDLNHRFSPATGRELNMLVESLNEMASQLNEQFVQQELRRKEQRAILQSMSSGMIALDLQQRVLSVNRAAGEMLGVREELARGRLLQEVAREPELNRFVSEAVARGRQTTAEFRLKGPEGRTILAVSEPLQGTNDEPMGLLMVMNDVTQIRKLERIRSDFAANVSHELRTPITNIKGYLETMLEVGAEDKEQTEEFLHIINRNTKRLEAIVEDLLALARLEQRGVREEIKEEPISLGDAVHAAVEHFSAAAKAKDITIELDVPAELVVAANPQLIEQAVSNLVSNAVKYSGSNTTVWVRARALDNEEIEIAVIDQGPGIEARHLPRLFERFYRVDRARSRELGGTGLGLAIVKHIALAHGGRAEAESEVGRGSTFRIVLPRG